MGTLHDQPIRNSHRYTDEQISSFIEDVQNFSNGSDLSISEVLKVFEIKEMERRNNLLQSEGDIWDEQISGIGEILQRIASALEYLNEEL